MRGGEDLLRGGDFCVLRWCSPPRTTPVDPPMLSNNSSHCLRVILVLFGGLTTLLLLSYSWPKSKNQFFAKTQNGCQRLSLASKFVGHKIEVAHFWESLKECKNYRYFSFLYLVTPPLAHWILFSVHFEVSAVIYGSKTWSG